MARLAKVIVLLAVLAAAGWGGWRLWLRPAPPEVHTAAVTRGTVSMTVTAAGRLAPTTEVTVGTEVSGTVGVLLVDHNDRVTRGQILARLKPEIYQAEHNQAQADFQRASAELKQIEVRQREAKRELDRLEGMRPGGMVSDQEYFRQLAEFQSAEAATQAGTAALEAARNRIDFTAYRLERTVITSPIDGVVLDRRVDVGQTVVAALQSPALFVLAEDLARMQLLADVSEADVGYVSAGQTAEFTVNAFRQRTFSGSVRQVRNQPRTSGNVVTYTVVIDVANSDLLLRPGMPTDVTIHIATQTDVPTIANAALRFRPPLPADEVRRLLDGLTWPLPPEPVAVVHASSTTAPAEMDALVPAALDPTKGTLWRFVDQTWRPVPVWARLSDNRVTVLAGGAELNEGESFVVEVRQSRGGQSPLQRAIMLSRPENRGL